ncbi:MAG: DNA primase DnaG [Nitrososphaeria archaeon]
MFSSELDLRDLQKSGRIGRIEIKVKTQGKKTEGKVVVPTSLDRSTTALVAAIIESVDRVGPYGSKVTIEKIEDARVEKRQRITKRAKEILYDWEQQKIPTDDAVFRQIEQALVKARVIEYGPDKLPAGPTVNESQDLLVVEGRADVNNLLKYGYNNAIAVEGVQVPKTIEEITHRKQKVTAFLDGDHGGDLILKELLMKSKIDYVARAPQGKEVEELTKREMEEALEKAVAVKELKKAMKAAPVKEVKPGIPQKLVETAKSLEGSLLAMVYDKNLDEVSRTPVSELAKKLGEMSNAKYVVFDGVVTQRLVDLAATRNDELYLIGARIGEISKKPSKVKIMTTGDL